jgi:hypothetical protein
VNTATAADDLAITIDDFELDIIGAGNHRPADDAPLWIRMLAAWRAEQTGGQPCAAHY